MMQGQVHKHVCAAWSEWLGELWLNVPSTTRSYGDGTSVYILIRKIGEAGDRSCYTWIGSLACYPLLYPPPSLIRKYVLERIVNNQTTAQKSVKRYFGGMVSWEKIRFVTCVQQISESDCTAYSIRIHISLYSYICVYTRCRHADWAESS